MIRTAQADWCGAARDWGAALTTQSGSPNPCSGPYRFAIQPAAQESGSDAMASTISTLLADLFALYLKTKNVHWHLHGPQTRDYHQLLDAQASQVLSATDAVAEPARKRGGTRLHPIAHIARLRRITDNEAAGYVAPRDLLDELRGDNLQLLQDLRFAHDQADDEGDIAAASVIEQWAEEAEGRVRFLSEASRLSCAEA
jgi:starvation-inducible DNA-binding protein